MTAQVPSSSGASISITGLLTRGSTQFGLLIILSVLWAVFASMSPGVFSGGLLILSRGVPVNGLPPEIGAFGRAMVGPVPALAIVALAIGGLLYILFAHSVLGRQILAVGANSRTAEMSGIPVSRVIVFVHVLSGVLAAAAGLMLTARLGAEMPAVAGDN